jgi:hypothetical protein
MREGSTGGIDRLEIGLIKGVIGQIILPLKTLKILIQQ